MSRFFESCLGLIGGLSRQSETFKVMERRLLKAIINPAMIVTWLAGIYLAWAGLWYWSAWFQIKFLLVVVLSAVHGFWARSVRAFARDRGVAERRARDRYGDVPQPDRRRALVRSAGQFLSAHILQRRRAPTGWG